MPLRRHLPFTALVAAFALAAPATGVAAAHHGRKSKSGPTIAFGGRQTKQVKKARKTTKRTSSNATATIIAQPRTVPAVCPDAQAPAVGTSLPVLRAAIVCLVNQQRIDRGLPGMLENPLLDTSAELWTNTMVATHVFWHGTNFSQRLSSAGYDWSNAGENVATGFTTPADVLAGWMASTGHCQNILNPNFADIGVGVNPLPVALDGGGSTWTQDFGLTMLAPYPSHDTGPMNGCPYTV